MRRKEKKARKKSQRKASKKDGGGRKSKIAWDTGSPTSDSSTSRSSLASDDGHTVSCD